MASIRETKTKWHIRFQEKGRKEAVISYPKTLQRRTIERKKIILEEKYALDEFDPWKDSGTDILTGVVINQYVKENKESGNWGERTYDTNDYTLHRMFDSILSEPVSDINNWQELFNRYPGNHNSKRGFRALVNAFLKWCYNNEYIEKKSVDLTIAEKISLRNDSKIKYRTWNELDDICRALEWRYKQDQRLFNPSWTGKGYKFYTDLYWFLFYSLLRKNEITKLRVQNLNGPKLTVHGKGRGNRIDDIFLPPPALAIAKKYSKGKKPTDHIFTSNMNRPYKHFRKAVKLALGEDHDTGIHMLRHGGAVHYFSLGKPIQFVSKLLRHKTIDVTLKIYANVIPDKMKEAFSDISHEPVKYS